MARDPFSRYRKQNRILVPHKNGQMVQALPFLHLRIPEVPEQDQLYHTKEGDRLDRVASAAYRTPLLWWLIAARNPAILDPLDIQEDQVLAVPPVDQVATL